MNPCAAIRPGRLLLVLGGAAVLAFGCFLLVRLGPGWPFWPGCLFHRTTGLECPGCGMTRAAHALLTGDLARAFRCNPLGVVLLPLALLGCALELAGWVRARPLPWRLHFGVVGTWILAGAVIAFGILRNIPMWPFSLLSPP
jgi:hypothetical protein